MSDAVEMVIEPRTAKVGNGTVRRVLPFRKRRMIGPFIFADLIGPEDLEPGTGTNVDAHPHIGLSTLTYLFAGRMVHRDSTGAVATIEPGAVNWMTAGGGVLEKGDGSSISLEHLPDSHNVTGRDATFAVEDLLDHELVVWFTGSDAVDPLSLDDRDALGRYLAAGGRLLLTGQSGGGKSTLLFALGRELAAAGRQVLLTATTRLWAAQIDRAPFSLIAPEPALLARVFLGLARALAAQAGAQPALIDARGFREVAVAMLDGALGRPAAAAAG